MAALTTDQTVVEGSFFIGDGAANDLISNWMKIGHRVAWAV